MDDARTGCAARSCGILYTRRRDEWLPDECNRQGSVPRPRRDRAGAAALPRGAVEPIDSPESFKRKAYAALKDVIVSMDVYRSRADIRLDERQLAQDFGISRTPVREAMAQLEREGFVRAVPRRGIYVVRKTKARGDRDDHRLGGAREHGGAADHRAARATRRSPRCARMFAQLRERRAARQARRIFRGEHRVPPDHHPHEPQRRADLDSPRTCSPICA